MIGEAPEARARRERRRQLFDGVAALYDETRSGYPESVVDGLLETAGLSPGSRVLEVGSGTGQLTIDLARRGLVLTAIDIGPAMAEATRMKVVDFDVAVETCAFEDFQAPPSTFAAVVSATAFHWIDPQIVWAKSAGLVGPGGWLAILATAERYDEPLGGAFREQWIRYSDDGGAWTTEREPTLVEVIASTGLFDDAVTSTHRERRSMAPASMVHLEQTRATTLSYDDATRRRFVDDLHRLLDGVARVTLTQETTLTMARVK